MKKVVEKRADIVFFIKMFPLVAIHPESYKKSQVIMCEKNNDKALALLEDAFQKRPLPEPDAKCTGDAVDENLEMGRKLGISGTPAIIFEDGRLISGALKAEQLIGEVDGKK